MIDTSRVAEILQAHLDEVSVLMDHRDEQDSEWSLISAIHATLQEASQELKKTDTSVEQIQSKIQAVTKAVDEARTTLFADKDKLRLDTNYEWCRTFAGETSLKNTILSYKEDERQLANLVGMDLKA